MAIRINISMDNATYQELEYLGRRFGINLRYSCNQLMREIITRCYLSEVEAAADPPTDPPKLHGFVDCPDDCEHCSDEPICYYSKFRGFVDCPDDCEQCYDEPSCEYSHH